MSARVRSTIELGQHLRILTLDSEAVGGVTASGRVVHAEVHRVV